MNEIITFFCLLFGIYGIFWHFSILCIDFAFSPFVRKFFFSVVQHKTCKYFPCDISFSLSDAQNANNRKPIYCIIAVFWCRITNTIWLFIWCDKCVTSNLLLVFQSQAIGSVHIWIYHARIERYTRSGERNYLCQIGESDVQNIWNKLKHIE